MARLQYGRRRPYLLFANDNEFFETYGFICNSQKHNLSFQWEYNQKSGAWGSEGRIHFMNTGTGAYTPIPVALQNRLTAGRGISIVYRVNCNDFIKELVSNYGFQVNPYKQGNAATNTPQGLIPPTNPQNFVPQQYLADYNSGFNM